METPGKKKVLVVDDSATMRMFLAMTVKKTLGVSVSEAVNGADALAKLQCSDFDLVLTDMVMPKMDGVQLIEHIRASLNKTMPIVMVTTKGEEKDRDNGLSSGANSYITKPVNVHELKEIILKLLKG